MNNEILEKLNKNLIDINNVENEMSMLQVAIYQKNIEKIEKEKLDELNSFLSIQAQLYNQNINEFKMVNEIIDEYKKSIDKIISIYNNLYLFVFERLSKARNNQKIAVANLITLSSRKERETISEDDKIKVENSIMACAQKKVNYMVIVDECNARIKWCIDEMINDINTLFSNKNTMMIVSNDNIFSKLKRFIFNKISGSSKFDQFLNDYIQNDLITLKSKVDEKCLNLITIIQGIEMQLNAVEKKIEIAYKKALVNL